MNYIRSFGKFADVSENLKYHIDNGISILENIFRPNSLSYYELIKEARMLYEKGELSLLDKDIEIFTDTDFGKFEEFQGEIVPLDLPIIDLENINEAEYKGKKVRLNKPMRSSGPKKYKVYVKNPKTGRIKVVNFGDSKGGLKSKINNPSARKSFVSRHKCNRKWKPEDKLKAGYWSCHLPRYKNLYSGSYSGYW